MVDMGDDGEIADSGQLGHFAAALAGAAGAANLGESPVVGPARSPDPARHASETGPRLFEGGQRKIGCGAAPRCGVGWPGFCSAEGRDRPPSASSGKDLKVIELRVPSRLRALSLSLLAIFAGLTMPIHPPSAAASASERSDRLSYVLMTAGSDSSTMSGSTDDLRRARSLRSGREGLLYFRQGRAAYVIRDAAMLRHAESIFEPQQALGARQAELGSRQAALGEQQARLGEQQARLGRQQADAPPVRAQELGRRQAALGRQQDALGAQQEILGREQAALGREHHGLARAADAKFRLLLAEALRRGLAQRVD
jgi:hypothetical protein